MNFVCVASFNFSGSKCIQLFCDFKEIVLSNEEKYGCCRCFQVNFKEMAFFFQYLCNKEFFCFPAQIAHLPIGKEIPRKMIFMNIMHHLLNPFTYVEHNKNTF